MTTYKAEGPDGNWYSITGPDNASDADVMTQLQQQYASSQQPGPQVPLTQQVTSALKNVLPSILTGENQVIPQLPQLPLTQPVGQTAAVAANSPQLEAFGRGLLRNTPGLQQATAALQTVIPQMGSPEYAQNLQDLVAQAKAAKAAYPVAYGAGAVTGALTPLLAGQPEGVVANAVLGGGLGAAQAVSDIPLNTAQAAKAAGIGGGLGTISGGILGALGGKLPGKGIPPSAETIITGGGQPAPMPWPMSPTEFQSFLDSPMGKTWFATLPGKTTTFNPGTPGSPGEGLANALNNLANTQALKAVTTGPGAKVSFSDMGMNTPGVLQSEGTAVPAVDSIATWVRSNLLRDNPADNLNPPPDTGKWSTPLQKMYWRTLQYLKSPDPLAQRIAKQVEPSIGAAVKAETVGASPITPSFFGEAANLVPILGSGQHPLANVVAAAGSAAFGPWGLSGSIAALAPIMRNPIALEKAAGALASGSAAATPYIPGATASLADLIGSAVQNNFTTDNNTNYQVK